MCHLGRQSLQGIQMNDEFVRLVEHHCQWISDEVKNFRHSDICRLNYCITWANDLLKLLEDKEEELEGMN
jgi:hypothetical protein